MKWVLLGLAVLSLFVCYRVGPGGGVELELGSMESIRIAATADTVTYAAAAIGAGLIGTASALGAAFLQASENKHKA